MNKDIVLTAALELLDEGGDRAVTFRALARKLGVTAMAVAYHAGTRKELFASLVSRVYANVGDDPDIAQPKARICAMLELYCECVIAHPNLARCIFAEPSLISGQLLILTHKLSAYLATLITNPSELDTVVGVVVDYTHGFALSAAVYSSEDEHKGTVQAQTIDDYRRGLGWLLDSISPPQY